jgi:shikimate kinase
MFLTLVGMSGIGKTYWSQKIAAFGFKRFGCDDLISDRLAKEEGVAAEDFPMHQWVGYPYEEQHASRAKRYLETEIKMMQEILEYLSKTNSDENIVIDTTGSFIYTPSGVIQALCRLTKVVYLDTTVADHQRMLQAYLEKPVAVLWNGLFQPIDGEALEQTFARCYPNLLTSREHLYRKISDVILPPEIHRFPALSTEDFLKAIG